VEPKAAGGHPGLSLGVGLFTREAVGKWRLGDGDVQPGSRAAEEPGYQPTCKSVQRLAYRAKPLPGANSRAEALPSNARLYEYDLSQMRGTKMSDYTTATGHDATKVQIAEGNQVRYWCNLLGCTEAQLRESVHAVGNSPDNVREFLKTLTERGVF